MSIFALLRNSRHILELKDTIYKKVTTCSISALCHRCKTLFAVIIVAQLWVGEGHPFYIHIQIKNAGLLAQSVSNDMASKVEMYQKTDKNLFLFSLLEVDVNFFTPLLVVQS